MENILHINSKDNVVVALSDLKAGTEIVVDGRSITLKDDVPAGHKIALQDFHTGDVVVKYGFPIGSLKEDRAEGSLINEKYIRTLLGEIKDYTLLLSAKSSYIIIMIGPSSDFGSQPYFGYL